MARAKQTKGKCAFCGKEFAKSGMGKHLDACPEFNAKTRASNENSDAKQTLTRLVVQGKYSKEYWFYIEISHGVKLQALDRYLRTIWLECCGHMSAFRHKGDYQSEIGMSSVCSRVFASVQTIDYEYDFGSTTELTITLIGERVGHPLTKHPIAILARNDAPEALCTECGGDGEYISLDVNGYESEPEYYCEACFEELDSAAQEMTLEVVNSPRMGVCGYNGPATPPY